MQITNQFEVAQPLGAVWDFFGNVPQVAACLPGTELTDELGDDRYGGTVSISLGPIKLDFDGGAEITHRDEDARTISVAASGADRKGRGQATLELTASLAEAASGTAVEVAMDLQLSGPAAQYGRGLVGDITAVLLSDFAANVQNRLAAIAAGRDPDEITPAQSAGGVAIGVRAAQMGLARVVRRFVMPYRPEAV
ncbi:SRPBCC family protein [Candidatus Poriferisodalis sp.]|uniref:SRPBCC family protein n=1 Tax=Candidatus Poriferisodalis sp. TaxID=3101277 RepID=UPI003B52021A